MNILNIAPKGAIRVLEILTQNGHQAFLVGGCVRDFILGHTPKDFDISTSALPDEVENLFQKTFPSGKEFGTITVVEDGEDFEVTTFRKEMGFNGRKPFVEFTDSVTVDLERRDLTINAICIALDGEVVDPFNGVSDLQLGIVRAVGDASLRFNEDPLRAIRAVRFSNKYSFDIEKDTLKNLGLVDLSLISNDRKRDELIKILMLDDPSQGLNILKDSGLLGQIIPEFVDSFGFDQKNPNHTKDVFGHILDVVRLARKDLRFAALLHDIGKPSTFTVDDAGVGHFYGHARISADMASSIMRRLNFSNMDIDKVCQLVDFHMSDYQATDKAARKLISKLGKDSIDLLDLMIADNLACTGDKVSVLVNLKDIVLKAISVNQPTAIKDLAINGNDLLAIGFKGKSIGSTLSLLLDAILDNPDLNNKDDLLIIAKLSRDTL